MNLPSIVLVGFAAFGLSCEAAEHSLIGCYETNFHKWGGGGPEDATHRLDVRASHKGRLELVLFEKHKRSEAFTFAVRPSRPEELREFAQLDGRAVEGLSQDPTDAQRSAPRAPTEPVLKAHVVVARVVDRNGAAQLVTIMPFTIGVLRKVACTE